jgi:hypothetical protein
MPFKKGDLRPMVELVSITSVALPMERPCRLAKASLIIPMRGTIDTSAARNNASGGGQGG